MEFNFLFEKHTSSRFKWVNFLELYHKTLISHKNTHIQSLQDRKVRYRLTKKVKKSKNDDFLKSFLGLIIKAKRMTIFISNKIYLKHFLIQATFYKQKTQKTLSDKIRKKCFLSFLFIKSCLDQKMLKINLVGNKNRHSFCLYDEDQK